MANLAVGQTVELSDGRIAVIRFLGLTRFQQGEWCGVELEDPSGKNDGQVGDERYFDCEPLHGMFVRPSTIVNIVDQPPPPRPPPQQQPPARTAAPPATAAAAAKRPTRTSSLFGTGTAGRPTIVADPGLAKRKSINAPSPSPAPRPSRPSSIARSPTKSPTKQFGTSTTTSSAANSRTATPSTTAAASRTSIGIKPRPLTTAASTRTSMGPPSLPASRTTRAASSTTTARSAIGGAVPTRTLGGRLSLAGAKPAPARPASLRTTAGLGNGTSVATKRASDDSAGSAAKGETEILSPQPTSPVRLRAAALEKLTSSPATTTPRSAAAAPASAGGSRPTNTNIANAQREIEDLKTKLKIGEKQRAEDREKLKQLESVQNERDKYHGIITKLQAKLQPLQAENGDLRKQLKEAESKSRSEDAMQAEHDAIMELATLDREMAEEMAEVAKQELEDVKEKLQELELEVEVLREENAELSGGMTPEDRASAGWLQMERTNERLREALIMLRDLKQQEERELRDQIKNLESDLKELGQTADQLAATRERLAQSEAVVEDLRQQLDNALGAEDMIEELSDRTMAQAEQIEELKAVVDDLENLKEIADELEVNHVQNEREMQEELDFKDAVIGEQARRMQQQEESLDDAEYTLSRFRELVTSLQTDLEDMRASHAVTETESEQLSSKSRAMMDLNQKLQISAAKAQMKTIDLELRRMEAVEAEQHLKIVKLFLPDTYDSDRDSVLALLRFRRLAFKANLLNGFLKERLGSGGDNKHHVGHEDELFAACDAVDKLTWVSAMCDRFANAIAHCSPERFSHFAGALYELEPVERAINGWIDGLRRDELKESACAAELSRSIALMTHLGEVHIDGDAPEAFADECHMRALLTQNHLESAASALHTARAMVQRAIPPVGSAAAGVSGAPVLSSGEVAEGESENGSGGAASSDGATDDADGELAQYFARRAEAAISQTRSTKVIAGKTVRALEELRERSLALAPDAAAAAFEQAEEAARELANLARRIGLDLHALLNEEGRTEPFSYTEVQSCIHKSVAAFTAASAANGGGDGVESDLFAFYLSRLRSLTSQMGDLSSVASDLSQAEEFERAEAPWTVRARELRAQKTMPADAEEELRRLRDEHSEARRNVAQRDEQLSTAQVKIETLEARMRDAQAKTSRIADLEGQLNQKNEFVTSLQEDIEKQDRELKMLEAERDKWKKVASDAARVSGVAAGVGGAVSTAVGQERAVATAREMDALRDEIAALQGAVRYLREDSRRARMAEQSSHDWLAEPLKPRAAPLAERRRELVVAEGKDALAELLRLAGSAKMFDLSSCTSKDGRSLLAGWRPASSTPRWHAARQEEDFAAWLGWRDSVVRKSRAVAQQQEREAWLYDDHGLHQKAASATAATAPRAGGLNPAERARAARKAAAAAARLHIRLPGANDKTLPGSGHGNHVQIVGSREWEGLQGRLAAVVV